MKKQIILIICGVVVAIALTGILVFNKTEQAKPEQQLGIIEGSLSYPSEFIPEDMRVCAENTLTKKQYCTTNHITNEKYKYGIGYQILAPYGTYYVFAATDYLKNYKAYYSEFVKCGLIVECPSHKPIAVVVSQNNNQTNIDPADWYSPSAE